MKIYSIVRDAIFAASSAVTAAENQISTIMLALFVPFGVFQSIPAHLCQECTNELDHMPQKLSWVYIYIYTFPRPPTFNSFRLVNSP